LLGGIGVGAHPPLFENDVTLRRNNVIGEDEAGHAIGLERHHRGEMLFGNALEIGGVVVSREGILLAAKFGDEVGETLRVRFGALEHQVFEEMRDARLARRIVGRAVLVPDHVGDDRRAVVGDHHDLHAVFKPGVRDCRSGALPAPGRCRWRQRMLRNG
jgi:hypothetical protein